ncbi:MAG: hypothetical protein ABFS03_09445 [Chloroflexota bacterium]
MDTKTIQAISKKVASRFPEVARVKPTVRKQTIKGKDKLSYLLIYKTQKAGPGGKKIHRHVRVVATDKGKIKKMTTSR